MVTTMLLLTRLRSTILFQPLLGAGATETPMADFGSASTMTGTPGSAPWVMAPAEAVLPSIVMSAPFSSLPDQMMIPDFGTCGGGGVAAGGGCAGGACGGGRRISARCGGGAWTTAGVSDGGAAAGGAGGVAPGGER